MAKRTTTGKVGLGHGQTKKRRVIRDNIDGVTKPSIRRLARRGGVKRLNNTVYAATREALKTYLKNLLKDVIMVTDYAKRKTVTTHDVVFALQSGGNTLYGFGEKV